MRRLEHGGATGSNPYDTRYLPRDRPELLFDWFRKRRRARILAEPFPAAWEEILARNVARWAQLDDGERARLRGLVQVFLAEKKFEGVGIDVDDEIRVTVAGWACVLLLHLDEQDEVFPTVTSIVVYPGGFKKPRGNRVFDRDDTHPALAGEAWRQGTVVLDWSDIARNARKPDSPRNVVAHEFAHALDQEDGHADGAPWLPSPDAYGPWARVLGGEYRELVAKASEDAPTDLDAYGATNPAEFFAVVTEAFFQKPAELKARHPALYEQLVGFYHQDPAGR